MATHTSVGSGNWSDAGTWDASGVPVDNGTVVIAAQHNVLMNADTSGFANGLAGVTITGHATNPGTLYFKNGTSGHLKIKTGTNLAGTTVTLRGRLLANSDGVWGNTGALAFADKAIIDLQGTAKLDAQNLDIALYCTQPTNKWVRTYGTKYDVVAGAGTVDVANNTIDLGAAAPADGTAVKITTAAGTLPGGLQEEVMYYVRASSGNTCKLATTNSDSTIVDLTSTGSGTITVFTGHTNTSTATMNVLEDVTGDTAWVTTDGHDRVVLADIGPAAYDQQRLQLTTINAGSIVLSANVDSAQYPGARIVLCSRNVSIRSAGTSTTQAIVDYGTPAYSGSILQCEISNTAGSGTTFYGYGVNVGYGQTISGTVWGCNYGVRACQGPMVSGVLAACGSGLQSVVRGNMSGWAIGCSSGLAGNSFVNVSGEIAGCSWGLNTSYGGVITGEVHGCNIGVLSGVPTFHGCTFHSNATDFSTLTDARGYGVLFPTVTIVAAAYLGSASYVQDDELGLIIYDAFGTQGYVLAWTAGGTVTTEAAPASPPVSLDYAYKQLGESATRYTWVDIPLWGREGAPLIIDIFEKLNEDPDNWDVGPKWQLLDPAYAWGDPAAVLDEVVAKTDGGDDTDWHTLVLRHTPTGDGPVILRAIAMDATAYFHWNFRVRQQGASGVGWSASF